MEPNRYKNITASGAVKNGFGSVEGIIINSHTGGTLKLWDSLSAAGNVLCNTITFGAGEHYIDLFDACFEVGLFATVGGTADITVVYS